MITEFERFVDSQLPELSKRNKSADIQYIAPNFLGPAVVYRPDLGLELVAALKFVLKNVVWTEDLKTRGLIEHWGLPTFQKVDGAGAWRDDCDGFMAAFRLILRKLGWDERVLRRTVCFVPTEEKPKQDFDGQFNHALLCINFSSGLLFLDNRFREPMSLFRLRQQGYINFSVLSAVEGLWHGLGLGM